jgi:hypothetical protein
MRNMPTSEKTTVGQDLRMVHPAVWFVIGGFLLIWVTLVVPKILHRSTNPAALPFLLTVPALAISLYILMIFWVNADSRRRRMNSLLWTLVGAFVPYGIGFIIYMLSRDPMPQPCPACAAATTMTHAFCPTCGQKLTPHCPSCGQPVESTWKVCAHCGKKLAS